VESVRVVHEKIPVMGKLGYKIWTETVDEEKK
jgi:hypothetical protein